LFITWPCSWQAGYKEFEGQLYFGDKPCFTDFQLAGAVVIMRFMFGDAEVDAMLAASAPTAAAAAAAVLARPKLAAFAASGFGGKAIIGASLNVSAASLTD